MAPWHTCLFMLALVWAEQIPQDIPQTKKPNLILIIADDLGWNDIGFRNAKIITPNLDSLAHGGIILNQSYMQHMCTPSRSAFLTGYYPFRLGMNHGVIRAADNIGLPTVFQLLPQQLKKLGYRSHMIGKWHLGFCNEKYLPENRGFDSFYGTYLGALDYYEHVAPTRPAVPCLFNSSNILENKPGLYLNELILQRTKQVLSGHDPSNPLFLYIPFTSPHSPLQAPEKYIQLYKGIDNEARRIYSAMVTDMDDTIGSIVNMLKESELYNNSIIVFSSDNGGQVKAGGNNFPLRGAKSTFYEGGTRVNAFVHSPLLTNTGYIYNGMIHAVDWFSTFLHLAGGKPDARLDGLNIWQSLVNNEDSPRKEFVYNIDTYSNIKGAIRVGDFKLIFGEAGLPNECIGEENVTGEYGNGATDVSDTADVPNFPHFRLFNIADDPYENDDLASVMPLKVQELNNIVHSYLNESVQAIFTSTKIPRYVAQCNANLCNAIEKPIPYIAVHAKQDSL